MRLPDIGDLAPRLANGARLRDQMKAQLERGEEPSGPRARWLRQSAERVPWVVAEQCDQLNLDQPEQAASLADALDILCTARAMLLAMAPGRRPST